jgi:CxxC motif-containing protein
MEKKEFVCIRCPLGCNITVETEQNEILSITGNTCPRGADYVTKELKDPRRIVTSLVRVKGGELPVVSVKTVSDIPKEKIMDCISALKGLELTAPVHIGDVVLRDVCGSGVDVAATKEVAQVSEAK